MTPLLIPINRAREQYFPGMGREKFRRFCRDAGALVVYGRTQYANMPRLQERVDSISGGNDHGSVSTVQGNETEEG
ncbi:MAG: hypothetical protein IKQ49_00105 [Eubacterium sp.]|nr:hypothetical protein [Eubacterium sp.]